MKLIHYNIRTFRARQGEAPSAAKLSETVQTSCKLFAFKDRNDWRIKDITILEDIENSLWEFSELRRLSVTSIRLQSEALHRAGA